MTKLQLMTKSTEKIETTVDKKPTSPEEEKKKPFSWLFMEIGGKKKEPEPEQPAPDSAPPAEPVKEETTKETDVSEKAETPEEQTKEEKKPFAWLFTEIGGKKKDKKKEDSNE